MNTKVQDKSLFGKKLPFIPDAVRKRQTARSKNMKTHTSTYPRRQVLRASVNPNGKLCRIGHETSVNGAGYAEPRDRSTAVTTIVMANRRARENSRVATVGKMRDRPGRMPLLFTRKISQLSPACERPIASSRHDRNSPVPNSSNERHHLGRPIDKPHEPKSIANIARLDRTRTSTENAARSK